MNLDYAKIKEAAQNYQKDMISSYVRSLRTQVRVVTKRLTSPASQKK